MFGHWLNKILNETKNVRRWQGRTMIIQRNDSEHMYNVAMIAEGLARIQEEVFGQKVDELELLRCCLFHDIIEIETGDFPSGVKRKTELMEKAVGDIERAYYESDLKPIIPKTWRNDYSGYILNPKQNKATVIGKIVAVADSMDALNECIQEVKIGNKSFKPYLAVIAEAILEIDIECGKYFIKYGLVDFGLPICEYGEKVERFVKSYEFPKNALPDK